MFQSLEELTQFLADRVSKGDTSLLNQLFNLLDGYFAYIQFDRGRCAIERDELPTTFGNKVPYTTEFSERIFQMLEKYSRYEEHTIV